MAGEYGEIDSRSAFYRMLGEAENMVQAFLAESPDDDSMQLIFEELKAMRRWSDHGREPRDDERGSINVGLVAARDLLKSNGDKTRLVQSLFALNNYFEDWPSDDQAAHAPDTAAFQLR